MLTVLHFDEAFIPTYPITRVAELVLETFLLYWSWTGKCFDLVRLLSSETRGHCHLSWAIC